MNKPFTFFRLSLIGLLMLICGAASAQKISSSYVAPLQVGPATATTPAFNKNNAIFCPTNSFNLTASTTDGSGNTFQFYEWYEVSAGGGANLIAGATTLNLAVSNATPGYHTYRVYGIQDFGGSQTCKASAYEDFTVYVLPPLTVTAAIPNATIPKYCTDNVPGSTAATTAIVITANAVFSGSQNSVFGLTNPVISDFELQYTWYKLDATTGARVGSALQTGTSNTYTIAESAVGTFKYQVDVVYTVKPACLPSYMATATQNNLPAVIIVTPKPGKPSISIN